MAELSQARIDANRRNAQKSTGPRTSEGKNISRANSLKHGFCASIIDTLDVESANLTEREAALQDELNPFGRAAQAYVIHLAVRRTGRLDRLDKVYHQKTAKLSRDAIKTMQDARKAEVEAMARMIADAPDIACRQLRKTSDGCQWMIQEWTALLITVRPQPSFDAADERRTIELLGRLHAVKWTAPCPIHREATAIIKHRELVTKLWNNRTWPKYYGPDQYYDQIAKTADENKVEAMGEESDVCRLQLKALMDAQIEELTQLKAKLTLEEAIEEATLSTQAIFDASDDGKLLHRYELELERSFLKGLKEVRDLNLHDLKMAQDQPSHALESNPNPVPPRPVATPTPRNEPKPPPPDDIFTSLSESPISGSECINLYMTVKNPPKHRR